MMRHHLMFQNAKIPGRGEVPPWKSAKCCDWKILLYTNDIQSIYFYTRTSWDSDQFIIPDDVNLHFHAHLLFWILRSRWKLGDIVYHCRRVLSELDLHWSDLDIGWAIEVAESEALSMENEGQLVCIQRAYKPWAPADQALKFVIKIPAKDAVGNHSIPDNM